MTVESFIIKTETSRKFVELSFFDSKYVECFLHSPLFEKQALSTVAGTAYSALTIIKLKNLIMPLPPLAEQKRIVAKLEEILPLCERLK